MTVLLQAPPNCEIRSCGREFAVLLPAPAAPSWKIRARAARRRPVLFAPSQENGRVVLLPIECVPSFYAPRRLTQGLHHTQAPKAREGPSAVKLRNYENRETGKSA